MTLQELRSGGLESFRLATSPRRRTGRRIAGTRLPLLLEKPIATTPEQCEDIVEAAERAGATFAVCHVMRYSPYSLTLQRLLDSGAIGDLVSVEHLEPIGWWHFAHSFVRGNWRRADESSFLLLAKCVHDIDWLTHVIGRPARRVSSFGGLYQFRADRRPEGAAERCVDCVLQQSCPYSAPKIYLPGLGDPARERWPLQVVTSDRTVEGVLAALRDAPYGRCVTSPGPPSKLDSPTQGTESR